MPVRIPPDSHLCIPAPNARGVERNQHLPLLQLRHGHLLKSQYFRSAEGIDGSRMHDFRNVNCGILLFLVISHCSDIHRPGPPQSEADRARLYKNALRHSVSSHTCTAPADLSSEYFSPSAIVRSRNGLHIDGSVDTTVEWDDVDQKKCHILSQQHC